MQDGSKIIKLNGVAFDISGASQVVNTTLEQLQKFDWMAFEKKNHIAVLRRAKHAYLTDLRSGIVKEKSGVDLSALLDGE